MESTIRFFRVRGIPVGAHWSWLFVFALVVWSLSTTLFPATYPGLDGSTYLFMGLAAAALFFGSVVLHELGHTFVALAQGEHDGVRSEVTVRSVDLPQVSGGRGLGVLVDTRDLRAVLPFRISFRDRPDIGGPSAGLAYALAIADMLDAPDDAGGRAIAATGTIDAEGHVGEVGGVAEKAIAAERAGADVFLVPANEMTQADDTPGLAVHGAEHLTQALQVLRATA